MRGCIRKRGKSYEVVLSLGYEVDPATGREKRKQETYTFKLKKEADRKLAELLTAHNRGEYVEPNDMTFSEWLDEWVETIISSGKRRLRTIETYESVIRNHVKPALGAIKLQKLQPTHLQHYYNTVKLSATTKEQHHTIIHGALEAARKLGMVTRNVASLVPDKPRRPDTPEDLIQNCWTAEEARKFLATAREENQQSFAFYTVALETGMRKGELCGLKWTDVDFAASSVTIARTLLYPGSEPVIGPPKNGQARTIRLAGKTMQLLRKHKTHQDEVKMANRPYYHDHGFVFAKEWDETFTHWHGDSLGNPIQMNNIGQGQYARLIKLAGVKTITFHGMRHTCATLALQNGTQPHVVQKLLGHKSIEITLDTYSHVLPDMKEEVAEKMSSLLRT